MSTTPSAPAASAKPKAEAAFRRGPATQVTGGMPKPDHKPVGYGLPCAKCKTYYSADLKACPVCKGTERVSAKVAPGSAAPGDLATDPAVLEEEREKFLREFKAQLLASPMPGAPSIGAGCIKEENHRGRFEVAAVCQSCADRQQERIDLLEAALHMDVKEAAKIVYDAVWADSSDPDKTYENAAQALLSELRRRSGVTPTFGLMKPLAD